MDSSASVHVPLYTGLGKHQVIVGHPVTLTIAAESGSGSETIAPCEVFVQVTHVDSAPGATDTWHVSVQNPTDQHVRVALRTDMGLPGFRLGGGDGSSAVVTVAPGQMVDVM